MRKPLGAHTVLALLARNQLRRLRRTVSRPGDRLMMLIVGVLGFYMAFTLVVLGAFFPKFALKFGVDAGPVELVNAYAVSILFGLFGLRFLFQKTPRLQLLPYLHLPVGRGCLIGFFVASTTLSLHNLFPLLFTVPLAVFHIAPVYGTAGAVAWTLGGFGLLLVSNFANLYLRTLLQKHEGLFLTILGSFMVITFLDEYVGAHVIRTISEAVFTPLLRADALTIASLGVFVLGTAVFAAAAIYDSVRGMTFDLMPPRRAGRLYELAERWSVVGHLVWLELRLMSRNRRPRHYLVVSLLFSTVYLVFLLASPAVFGEFVFAAVMGLFASGGFVLNYGQLMFGWDSMYFDGIIGRDLRMRVLARSKVLVLQGSCLFLFVISLPLFLWLRPDLVPLHVAFLFYNAGVTSQLIMELAVRNSDPIDLGRNGGVLNYEGFSIRHWLWFFPTALPPTLLLLALKDQEALAWTLLAVIGLVGLAATEMWIRRHAAALESRKHYMAAGFRGR
jgi:hypothetical protein